MLVEYFAGAMRRRLESNQQIDKNTLKLCQSYHWPGNIRELQNIVERSVILCAGDTFWIDEAWLSSQNALPESSGPLTKTLKSYERNSSKRLLRRATEKLQGQMVRLPNLEFRGRR